MKTLIIAEAGVNHNGDLGIAEKLIVKAAEGGADLIKFQSFLAEKMTLPGTEKAAYQKASSDTGSNQFEMLKALELTREQHIQLLEKCKKQGIGFFSSAFDLDSIEMLENLNFSQFVKVPSGELTNLPYLRKIARTKKQILLSTGLCTLADIENAIDIIEQAGTSRNKITILQCTSEYPAAIKDVNLRAMLNMKATFGTQIGYSDHTLGIEVPIAAVALGATVIEKHFTLDRKLPGPDHNASLEPDEFAAMVKAIRNIESALGDGIKRPSQSELTNLVSIRKSVVAQKNIKVGEVFSETNLTTKRPGLGISPMRWDQVLGQRASRDFSKDEMIEL